MFFLSGVRLNENFELSEMGVDVFDGLEFLINWLLCLVKWNFGWGKIWMIWEFSLQKYSREM
jgi:hypothetical protein